MLKCTPATKTMHLVVFKSLIHLRVLKQISITVQCLIALNFDAFSGTYNSKTFVLESSQN